MELDLKKTLGNLILAVLILLLLARAVSFAGEVQPTPLSVVESESMEPALSVGDLVFWGPTTMDNVEVGDIVVFSSQVGDAELIIHRVVEIQETNGERQLITQGDANDHPDPRPVTEENLLGAPISVAGRSLRMPRIGYVWMWLSALVTGAIAGGLAGGGLAMLVPFLTAGIMIILTIVFISSDDDDEDEKLKRLIIEEESSRIWQIFLIIFILFAFIIVPSTWYGYETVSMSIGVDERATGDADHVYSTSPGEIVPGNQTVENPGHVTLTHHVLVRGDRPEWVHVEENNFRTSPGGNNTVQFYVEIPENAEPGTYDLELADYHSPFWTVYPQNFASSVIESSPSHGVLMLNFLTTFIFASATLLLMLLFSYVIDRYVLWKEFRAARKAVMLRRKKGKLSMKDKISMGKKRAKDKVLAAFDWIRGVDVIEFEPEKPVYASLVGLIAVPLYFLNADLWSIFLLVPLSSALAYHLGCRWRSEIFTAALISSAMVFMILLFIPFSIPYLADLTVTNLTILLQSLAVIILIYIISSPVILFVSYLTAFIFHRYRVNSPSHTIKKLSDI